MLLYGSRASVSTLFLRKGDTMTLSRKIALMLLLAGGCVALLAFCAGAVISQI